MFNRKRGGLRTVVQYGWKSQSKVARFHFTESTSLVRPDPTGKLGCAEGQPASLWSILEDEGLPKTQQLYPVLAVQPAYVTHDVVPKLSNGVTHL